MYEKRYSELMTEVHDAPVRAFLEANADGDPDARVYLQDYLEEKVSELINELKAGVEPARAALPSDPKLKQLAEADSRWSAWTRTIKAAAELLWRGTLLEYPTEKEARLALVSRARWWTLLRQPPGRQNTQSNASEESEESDETSGILLLEQVTAVSHQLMLLWMGASLHQMRTVSNIQAHEQTLKSLDARNPTRVRIRQFFRDYLNETRAWDRELWRLVHARFFRAGLKDIQQFKTLDKNFGPGSVTGSDLGWIAQAAESHEEIRFQLLDEVRRQRWRAGKYLSSLAYGLLRVTTGYGTRPIYFVRFGAFTIAIFWALFFLNDFFNAGILSGRHFCSNVSVHVAHWYDPLLIAARYLYVAVVNLSSLGSDSNVATHCGGTSTQLLLTASALTGYFLLATLAALLFKLITEGE